MTRLSSRPRQRHECKYLVPEVVARRVAESLRPFLEPDPYAARCPGFTYPIASLYLDSPGLRLYHETQEGQRNRFKLRVRGYSEAPDAPLFLEIKRRFDRVIRKARCGLPRERALDVVRGWTLDPAKLSAEVATVHDEFRGLVDRIGARPRVLVRYDRTAFVGTFDRTVRVTFDRHLRAAATNQAGVEIDRTDFLSVESKLVVLELKFTDRCPPWLATAVRNHELQRRSYSKYALSVDRTGSGLIQRELRSGGCRELHLG